MASGTTIDLFRGYSEAVTTDAVFRVQMQKSGGTYQVRMGALSGSNPGTWVYSNWYDLSTDWNALETEFISSYNTGEMSLWVGGLKHILVRGNAIARPRQVC